MIGSKSTSKVANQYPNYYDKMVKRKQTPAAVRRRGLSRDKPSALIGTDRWQREDFDPDFLLAVTDEAAKRNWQIVELELFDGSPPEGVCLDGIFMRSLANQKRTEELRKFSNRLIRIGFAPNPDDDILPAVLPDLRKQGEMAAIHFADRGFSRIGLLRRRPQGIWRHLYEGVRELAHARTIDFEPLSLPAFHPAGGKMAPLVMKQFYQWVKAIPKPVGLVGATDYFAAKLCAWTQNAGLRVPTDVAIIGIGNSAAICERCLPRLTSVQVSEYERGVTACELMANMIAGQPAPREPVLIPPSGITVRESTDILAAVAPELQEALAYMWANIAKDISVDDVAAHAGIHRRKLERSFRSEFGRGVNAELRRRRLEKSCELLKETDLPVTEVSLAVGFHSDDYFYRAFRSKFGATPLQWRKAHQ